MIGITKTIDDQIKKLGYLPNPASFRGALVDDKTLDNLINAHQLKYIENVIEVEEELKLAKENIIDFCALDEELQKKAIEAYPLAQADPDYFAKPEADQKLFKPVLILSNIDNKKNEAKVKTWKVEYHARLIGRLRQFRTEKKLWFRIAKKIASTISIFKIETVDDHGHITSIK